MRSDIKICSAPRRILWSNLEDDLHSDCLEIESELFQTTYKNRKQCLYYPLIKMLNATGCNLPESALQILSSSGLPPRFLSEIQEGPSGWVRGYGDDEEKSYNGDIEYVFRNILTKEMFSFEQKVKMAQWVLEKCRELGWLCRANSRKFGYRYTYHPLYTLRDIPEYTPIGFYENCDYEVWVKSKKGSFRDSIVNAYEGELPFIDFAKYDTTSFDFIIGDCMPVAKTLMHTECLAKLQIELNSAVENFNQFCAAVDQGANLGWRRDNVYEFEAKIGNSRLWVKITDEGKLTGFFKRHFG